MKLKVFLLLQLAMLFVACESDVDNTLKKSGSFGSQNGHEYVDLGLSVKWATCNVGATKPEEYGNYFAWGEIVPKNEYSWSTYFDTNDEGRTFIMYNNRVQLDSIVDAAHTNWGGTWRMPTIAEWAELKNHCTWSSWITNYNGISGLNGYLVSGKDEYASNSIFLPAAGYHYQFSYDGIGYNGSYWSSSLQKSRVSVAYYFYFLSDTLSADYDSGNYYRYYGFSVRPVCP